MNKKSVFKLFILGSISFASLVGCNRSYYVGEKAVNVYGSSSGNPTYLGQINLRFFNEQKDIPYIAIDTFLNSFKSGFYNINYSNNKFIFTNVIWAMQSSKNYKYNAIFDISSNALTYEDYTCFICDDATAYNPLDLINGRYREYQGKFKHKNDSYTAGNSTTIDLDDYSIKTYYTDGRLYFPLYTAKCLFTTHTTSYFYNGVDLFIDAQQANCKFNSLVRQNLFTPSLTYLEYAFNQFALDIDLHFGMRNFSRVLRSKNNTSYKYMGGNGGNAYSVLNPLKANFISSATNFDDATHDFYKTYLDDGGHTGLYSRSYYKPLSTGVTYGEELTYKSKIRTNINNARTTKSRSPGIYYINNADGTVTNIFSFNRFYEDELDVFYTFVNNVNNSNTAHVVIDLSCNGGGYIYFADMLINWLTRGRASSYILSAVNGSKGSVQFDTDNNNDGNINSNDYLPTTVKTVDIITSGYSFSAANYTACMVAKYGDDTDTNIYIDGENSGGGVCSVEGSMMNAIGMTAQWSSLYRLCELKSDNSYVGIDDGVTAITKDDGETAVTINGEKWNSLNENEVLNYPDYAKLNSKIITRK